MILTESGRAATSASASRFRSTTVRDLLPQLKTGKVTRGLIGVSVDRRPLTQELANSYGLPSKAGAVVRRSPRAARATTRAFVRTM